MLTNVFIAPALAHGASVGASDGALGPLIFIPAIIGFGLFLYFSKTKK